MTIDDLLADYVDAKREAPAHATCAQQHFCVEHYIDDGVDACRPAPLRIADVRAHQTCEKSGFCVEAYKGTAEKPCRSVAVPA